MPNEQRCDMLNQSCALIPRSMVTNLIWPWRRNIGEMMTSEQPQVSSTSPRDRRHSRFTSHAKTAAVLRLLKGESVETVSDELGITIGRLERWKDRFVSAGSAELAKRTDVPSNRWVAKHLGSIWQWMWLLAALVAIISILTVFMQRGG